MYSAYFYRAQRDGGGKHGDGTVFSITTSGTETVLHGFSGSDGAHPGADLLDVDGTLYGTTTNGGANDSGTVFSIATSGYESVLLCFQGPPDGGRSRRQVCWK